MSFLDAIILGIVEGITEFLPISSTGHLILAAQVLQIPETEFLKTFEISIQLGAILAVCLLYWRRLFLEVAVMKRILVALLPALGVGFLFYASIKKLFESPMTVVAALFLGGIALILFEWFQKGKEGDIADMAQMSYKTAFLVGLFQALAVVPGVSRAGATILGGLLLGMKRKAVVEFSFLLAVPTMIAATTLDLAKNAASFSGNDFWLLFTGFTASFLVAILAIKLFIRFVETHSFISFGVYRIAIAILFFFVIL